MLQVESFEDLQKGAGIAIHKPFFCSAHPGESLKFFCIGCQVTVVLLIDTCYGSCLPRINACLKLDCTVPL